MRTYPRIAVASMAVLFAVTGCSKLGANAGAATEAGAGAPAGAFLAAVTGPGAAVVPAAGGWVSDGRRSSPLRPFQARLTRCAATSAFSGLRESSQCCPVRATMPTSIRA